MIALNDLSRSICHESCFFPSSLLLAIDSVVHRPRCCVVCFRWDRVAQNPRADASAMDANTTTRDAHTHAHPHGHAHAHPAHHTPVHIRVVEEVVIVPAGAAGTGPSAEAETAKFQEVLSLPHQLFFVSGSLVFSRHSKWILSQELKNDFKQLEAQFLKHFGADAVDKLRASCTRRPVITIGGDQVPETTR